MSDSSIGKWAALTLVPRVPLVESEDCDLSTDSSLDAFDLAVGKRAALMLVPRVPLFESEDVDLSTGPSLDNCAGHCGLGLVLVDHTFLRV